MTRPNSELMRAAVVAASVFLMAAPALAEQPEDAWITTKAKTLLLTDDVVDGLAIHVDTFDAHVTLYGQVHSKAEKEQAERRVRAIDGVAEVHNLLAIVPAKARAAAQVADEALEKAVTNTLAADRALIGSDIDVKSVHGGTVVLSGSAKSLSARRHALARVRGIEGVRSIQSEISTPDELADREIWEQEGDTASPDKDVVGDAWITTKAKLSLMADSGISPMRVNVDTTDGVVTLFGSVDTAADKTRAASEIAKIDGVKRVENALQVVPDVAAERVEASDDVVTAAVLKRIAARPSISDSKIHVATENGVVRLTGEVASQRDRLTALTVARSTTGARSVIDDLELRTN